MTYTEAITILREAEHIYAGMSRLAHEHDIQALTCLRPVSTTSLLDLYILGIDEAVQAEHMTISDRRIEYHPLVCAIDMACSVFRSSCVDGDLVARINHRHSDDAYIDRMLRLIRCCIELLQPKSSANE